MKSNVNKVDSIQLQYKKLKLYKVNRDFKLLNNLVNNLINEIDKI